MTDGVHAILLFRKDFTEQTADKFFVYDGQSINEVDAYSVANDARILVTHDYWLIAPSIYRTAGSLPKTVVDVVDFKQFISGKRLSRKNRSQLTLRKIIRSYFDGAEALDAYFSCFYKKTDFESDTYIVFAKHLEQLWGDLQNSSIELGEWERYLSIEMPVTRILETTCARGIRLDRQVLADRKAEIDFDFYLNLKVFALTYNVHFEVPSDAYLKDELVSRGFNKELPDLSNSWSTYRLDDFLKVTPMADNFGENALLLRKISRSRQALGSISKNSTRARPILDCHGTVTSRIYYQSPTIQNMARKYRDVFCADPGKSLLYIDYDQFEIGIMAALSNDESLFDAYKSSDVYSDFAKFVFGNASKRGIAKGLLLSFTYGMQIAKICDIVRANNGIVEAAVEFFDQFEIFSKWRAEVAEKFRSDGRIGTLLGNYLNRVNQGPLTAKESRSCVSQVVQGTGSLIFKKAVIALDESPFVDVLIPMHDAALIQYAPEYDPSDAVLAFKLAMRHFLGDGFPAKASVESFWLAPS